MTHTPPEIAKLLHVGRDKVLAWIRSGELPAANLSDSGRPRYAVTEDDLAAFLEARKARTVTDKPQPRRRRRTPYKPRILT